MSHSNACVNSIRVLTLFGRRVDGARKHPQMIMGPSLKVQS
jgi:hypothetical protein